jgi:outer membrane protein assembly factor BamB
MNRCQLLSLLLLLVGVGNARADDWPQWLGPQRDSVWRESGILEKFPAGGPKVKWRVAIGGGFAGPAVAAGRVYLTDRLPADAASGNNPGGRERLGGKERVWCFSATDGKVLWKHEYECPYQVAYASGPRCTPTVAGDKVYVLGAEGHLLCLDAANGTVIWSRELTKDYATKAPLWGYCGHPLVDGPRLICVVGGAGSVAVAFDKDTGKELWRSLSAKEPGYCPPTLIEAGGRRQLLIWHAEALNSLEPETGKLYWSVPLAPTGGMAIMTPRKLGDYLFASGNGDAAVLLKLATDNPAVEEVWRGQRGTAVYCSNSTPFLEDGLIFGCDWKPGPLRCVKLLTGERVWESFAPTSGKDRTPHGTAFIVKNGARFFLMSETGDLIIARLSAKGYEEISRCKLLAPTGTAFGRSVVWSHPAFAERCVFARNDKELICACLAAE